MRTRFVGLGVGMFVVFLAIGLMGVRPALGDLPPQQKKGAEAAKGAATKDAGKRGYVPRAGYLRTNKQLFLDRKNTENSPRAAPGAPTPVVVRGVRSLPVILLEYKNVSAPFAGANYKDLLFGDGKKKTMSQYYRDQSQGRFKLTGQVMGWYKLPKDDTFYENGNNGSGAPFGEMLTFGLQKADQDADFGQFDNDGPDGRPNSGDDDGVVDTVFFIHPEAGAECGGGNKTNIWSHSWHYDEPAYGHNGPFVTNDIRKNPLGEPVLNSDGSPQHITVVDYTIQPGLSCSHDEHGGKKIIEIGVFCHEYGHALGLPDLYDRTPSGDPDSEGVGNYCLMAGGSYGGDGAHPETPCNMSAWCKYYLGWAPVVTITADGPVNFEPVQDRNLTYRLFVPNTNQEEYFLFEYRHNRWVDDAFAARLNWDEFLPVGGLAVWHVDERVGKDSGTWPFSPLDQGQNDAPVHVLSSPPRFGASHPLVALVQADGRLDLEQRHNRGDDSDLWDTGKSFLDDARLLRGSRGFDNRPTGIALSDINLDSGRLVVELANLPRPSSPAGEVAMRSPTAGSSPTRQGAQERPDPGAPANQGLSARNAVESRHVRSSFADAKQGVLDRLKRLDRLIDEKGAAAMTSQVAQALKSVSTSDLREGIGSKNLPDVLSVSARARTEEVTLSSKLERKATAELQKLIAQGMRTKEALVRYAPTADPSDERVERITNLSVPALDGSPDKDAAARIAGDLRPLLGEGVMLDPASSSLNDAAAGPRRFQQVFPLGNDRLPIFGREAVLFYDQQKNLTAMTSNTVLPKLIRVDCKPGDLKPDEAKQIVARRLGVAEKVITEQPLKGYFLLNGDPQRTHVAYRVLVSAGQAQRPIEVYIDSETKETLMIQ